LTLGAVSADFRAELSLEYESTNKELDLSHSRLLSMYFGIKIDLTFFSQAVVGAS
jgi:hypothetical protein